MRNYLLLFLFVLIPTLSSAADGVFVSSSVDRNEMRPGDTFTLSMDVESEGSADVGQPEWPKLNNFQAVNTWTGSQIQSVFENNKFITKRKQSYHLQLQALREGEFSIDPIRINVNGQIMATKPIRIVVSANATAAPQAQEEDDMDPFGGGASGGIDDIFNQMLQSRLRRYRQAQPKAQQLDQVKPNVDSEDIVFVDSEVDKDTAYEGEQITVSFYLYTRAQISDIDTLKYPTLAGFWKEDIEVATRLNFKNVSVNGIPYNRALLASYALFPIKAGKAQVDTYTAKLTIANFNPFGRQNAQSVTKSSKPINIKVLPLPAEGKPDPFTGGVGDFQLKASLDNKSPEVNQPITLILRFEGRGNAKLIEIPKLQFHPALELYDSQSESAFYPNGTSYKEFRLLLIPRQAGEMQVASFPTSFFSPTKKEYYTLSSEEFVLDVKASTQQNAYEPSQQALVKSKDQKPQIQLPAMIKNYKESSAVSGTFRAVMWGGLYSVGTLVLMALAYVEFGRKEKREKLRSLVQKRVKKIEELYDKKETSLASSEAVNLIYFTLGELSDVGGGSEELEKMIMKAPPSFRTKNHDHIIKLMKFFETLAFAPKELTASLSDKKVIKENISKIKSILIEATQLDFSDED